MPLIKEHTYCVSVTFPSCSVKLVLYMYKHSCHHEFFNLTFIHSCELVTVIVTMSRTSFVSCMAIAISLLLLTQLSAGSLDIGSEHKNLDASPYNTVSGFLRDCYFFLTGIAYFPTPTCCISLGAVNALAHGSFGARNICYSIEAIIKGRQPQMKASQIALLPRFCGTVLSFPVSDSMDCSQLNFLTLYTHQLS